MRQNISIMRERTHKLNIRLVGSDGRPYIMTSNEKLRFGVKKQLTDSEYKVEKIVDYKTGFKKIQESSVPEWKPNTYYSKVVVSEEETYILTTSEPEDWEESYNDYYINDGLYPIIIEPEDTENMTPTIYYYDVGLQRGDDVYYSVIDTSKFELLGNVTKIGESSNE